MSFSESPAKMSVQNTNEYNFSNDISQLLKAIENVQIQTDNNIDYKSQQMIIIKQFEDKRQESLNILNYLQNTLIQKMLKFFDETFKQNQDIEKFLKDQMSLDYQQTHKFTLMNKIDAQKSQQLNQVDFRQILDQMSDSQNNKLHDFKQNIQQIIFNQNLYKTFENFKTALDNLNNDAQKQNKIKQQLSKNARQNYENIISYFHENEKSDHINHMDFLLKILKFQKSALNHFQFVIENFSFIQNWVNRSIYIEKDRIISLENAFNSYNDFYKSIFIFHESNECLIEQLKTSLQTNIKKLEFRNMILPQDIHFFEVKSDLKFNDYESYFEFFNKFEINQIENWPIVKNSFNLFKLFPDESKEQIKIIQMNDNQVFIINNDDQYSDFKYIVNFKENQFTTNDQQQIIQIQNKNNRDTYTLIAQSQEQYQQISEIFKN